MSIFKSWKNYFKIKKKLNNSSNYILFYAENSSDWVYLNPIIKELKFYNEKIIKITSQYDDQVLSELNTFYIGSETVLNILFRFIHVKAIVMTDQYLEKL